MKNEQDSLRSIHLPIPVSTFIGREQEIAVVRGLVRENRLITLTGAGGSGKTRLALKIAHEFLDEFKNNIRFVELASLKDPSRISQKIASILGVREQSKQLLRDSLIYYLSTSPSLLILDNCEHLIEACAEIVDILLKKCADLKILATSREVLGITGEVNWIVPPLSLPEVRPWRSPASARDDLIEYQKSEAVQLFTHRSKSNDPNFQLTSNNSAWVAEICRRLDGMPLAIELAAARVRTLSVRQIAERLGDRFNLLTDGSRTASPRHQTLNAAIEWSYALLSKKEQKLLQRLSVFSSGGMLKAIEVVCEGESIQQGEVLDTLSQLVNKSLVVANRESGKKRYSLLETIREFAIEKFAESQDVNAVKDRHLDFFLQFAEEAEPNLKGPDELIWYEHLEDEHDNLRAALAWALESQNPVSGIRLTSNLVFFWLRRGYLGEGIDWAEKMLSQGQDVSAHSKADALKNLGSLLLWREKEPFVRSANLLEESLTLYRQLGDKTGVAWVLNRLGLSSIGNDDFERAGQLLSESLSIYRMLDDPWYIADTLGLLNFLAWLENDLEVAKKYSKESLDWYQKAGYQRGLVGVLNDLGDIALKESNPTHAITFYKQHLEKLMQFGDRWLIADNVEWLAVALNEAGRHEGASRLIGAADAIREMIGIPVRRVEDHERNIAAIKNYMDDEKFSQLWKKGRKMSLEQILEYINEEPKSEPFVLGEKEHINSLTPRERETAILIAEGKSNREIAEAMTVTVKTVEAYVTRIRRKLGLASRVQIATWVMDNEIS